MKKAIYPGSFDPVHYGHLDVIRRAAQMFDELTVSVLNNKVKTPLFSVEERVKILKEAVKDIPNVKVESFSGLLVDYAKEKDVHVVIRGLRAITDFEYELHGPFKDLFGICLPQFFERQGNFQLRRRYFHVCTGLFREADL